VLATLWVSRFAAALLYGVEPHDAMTLLTTAFTVVSIAVVAGWLPASRATRMDLTQVLKANSEARSQAPVRSKETRLQMKLLT
jgi:hypothetical protein